MTGVGYLMLQWGMFEADLRKVGKSAREAEADYPDLQRARELRNLVAHGINSATADPLKTDEPHLVCTDQQGCERHVTLSDLERAVCAIEGNRHKLR
jgi:hypothetical protein